MHTREKQPSKTCSSVMSSAHQCVCVKLSSAEGHNAQAHSNHETANVGLLLKHCKAQPCKWCTCNIMHGPYMMNCVCAAWIDLPLEQGTVVVPAHTYRHIIDWGTYTACNTAHLPVSVLLCMLDPLTWCTVECIMSTWLKTNSPFVHGHQHIVCMSKQWHAPNANAADTDPKQANWNQASTLWCHQVAVQLYACGRLVSQEAVIQCCEYLSLSSRLT